jgi:hypothetical protein
VATLGHCGIGLLFVCAGAGIGKDSKMQESAFACL